MGASFSSHNNNNQHNKNSNSVKRKICKSSSLHQLFPKRKSQQISRSNEMNEMDEFTDYALICPSSLLSPLTPETHSVLVSKRSRKVLNFLDHSNENTPCASYATATICRLAPDKGSFLEAFFRIFDDDVIQDFLWMDSCFILSDKYLLAMVYAYFRRAKLHRREYNRKNFFAALYLAHDVEEDNEDLKLEIYPWALGRHWRRSILDFVNHRDLLLKRMQYRSIVSKVTCDEIMGLCSSHPLWKRTRKPHHGGAKRVYPNLDGEEDFSPRGPGSSPLQCFECIHWNASVESDRLSLARTSGYLSADSTFLSPNKNTSKGSGLPSKLSDITNTQNKNREE